MMRELRIGDRVRTPYGDGVIVGHVCHGKSGTCYSIAVSGDSGIVRVTLWDDDGVEPLPPDIPRERVADLLAAVEKRVERLASEKQAAAAAHFTSLWPDLNGRHKELAHIATALRKLLGGES
jgi:hypothetical protein